MTHTTAPHFMNPHEIKLDAGLYCVPTPIGNLRDITLRALDVFRSCDMLVCEDSRVAGKLLKSYEIPSKKKIIYNDHATTETRDYIVSLIAEGKVLALISDAGTPLISDPGYKLVRACFDAGIYVTALPGANAVLPAMQLSGLPSDHFTFAGFLPHKVSGVEKIFGKYKNSRETLVFYDAASRLPKTLKVIVGVLGDRQIAVVREISKLYEESIRGSVSEVLAQITDNPIKGEIVLVVEGVIQKVDDVDVRVLIQKALDGGESVKELAARIASQTGGKKKDIYNLALRLRDE